MAIDSGTTGWAQQRPMRLVDHAVWAAAAAARAYREARAEALVAAHRAALARARAEGLEGVTLEDRAIVLAGEQADQDTGVRAARARWAEARAAAASLGPW